MYLADQQRCITSRVFASKLHPQCISVPSVSVDVLPSTHVHAKTRNSTNLRGMYWASVQSLGFDQFHVALGILSGGVLYTQQTGLRFLPVVFLPCSYTTRIFLGHSLIHIIDDNIAELHFALFHACFDFLSGMVT